MKFVANLAKRFKRFKFNIYSEASGAGRDGEMKKVSFLLHVIGEEEIYNRFHTSDVRLN